MSNPYFNHDTRLVPFSTARAEDVNDLFDGVATGFDQIEADITEESGALKAEAATIRDATEVIKDEAAAQAATATAQAGIATTKASEADASADAALASQLKAADWAERPVEVEAGQYSAKYWAQQAAQMVADGVIDDAQTRSDLTWSSQKISEQGIPVLAYDSRGNLRSVDGPNGKQTIVEGLGLFVFRTGSDEPDDDESCFATATGRWLLEAAHWDVVSMWQLPDDEARDDAIAEINGKFLYGTATCTITSLANASGASFTGTVTGAAVGDRVIANPPAQLGNIALDTGHLSYYAWVSAPDTITVMLTSSSAANTNTAIRTAWPITVIKS